MNKAIKLDAREIKQQASGRWLEIIPSIDQRFSAAAQSVGNHVPCPLGTGDKDGFRFGESAKEDGHAFSNSGAPLGDGFAVLQWANNGNFREVLEKVNAYLNNGNTKPVTQKSTRPHTSPSKAPKRPKKESQALIKQIIETASKAPTSAVKAYLESRGLSDVLNNYPEALLSHSKLAYPPNGTYPAMTGTITNLQGDVIGIQRHYLTKDGAKLDIKNHDGEPLPNKTMLGIGPKCLTGGSVKLGIPQDVVNITEGIETALAVLSATGTPTWATNTAALLAKTEVPESVKTVYIWADKDRNTAGKKAAIRLADKLIREGHIVSILEPPLAIPAGQKGVDWLDVYTRSGSKPFIQAINANTQQPKKDVVSSEWVIRGECVEEDVKTINRKFTHIVTGGKNYIATIGTDAADNKMMIFYKLDEFKSMMGHYPKATIYAPSGAATKRNIGAVWLEHEDARVCYNGVTFRPVNERFYKGKLNTYFGHGVEAIEHSQEDVAPYLDHIKQIICDNNEECYQYVINWLAHMIQKPEEKPGVAIIMKSGQGTGKGVFVEPLRKIMGSHYCYADKSGMLTGRF
ncbi:MAG: toprim domain-containing protein, partial [Marinomonas sp.]